MDNLKFTYFNRDVQWIIVASLLFPLTVWWVWIWYIYKFYWYSTTNKVIYKGKTTHSIKKSDKRFKTGYKTVGTTKVSVYEKISATQDDIIRNKNIAWLFAVFTVINVLAIFLYFKI